MLVNMFLKLDGIEGESANEKHKGEIDLLSANSGGEHYGTFATGGGGGSGTVSLGDYMITKKVDKSSPKLFEALCTGKHIKSAVISMNKAGGDQEEFMKVTLSDLMISTYMIGGSTDSNALPEEKIEFNFAKMEMEYKEQKSTGSVGGAVKAGWDVKAGKKV